MKIGRLTLTENGRTFTRPNGLGPGSRIRMSDGAVATVEPNTLRARTADDALYLLHPLALYEVVWRKRDRRPPLAGWED